MSSLNVAELIDSDIGSLQQSPNLEAKRQFLSHSSRVALIKARFEEKINAFNALQKENKMSSVNELDCTKGLERDLPKLQLYQDDNVFEDELDSKELLTKPIKPLRQKKRVIAQIIDSNQLLISASKEGNLDVVKWLVEHGTNPDHKDNKGRSALLSAACKNKMDVFKYLLNVSNINQVDQNGWNVMHIAAITGCLKLIEEVNGKISLNTRSRSGLTPLCLAVNMGHLDVVEYLLKEGADTKISSHQGWSPLHFAAKGNNFSLLYVLIESGKCVNLLNSTTSEGQTPLALAVQQGSFPCTQLLLDSGADPSPRDNRGWTPARIAAIHNFRKIGQYLANYKAII